MLVTTIPTALDKGATLLYRVRVERLQRAAGKTGAKERIESIIATALSADGVNASPHRVTIRAKHFVLSAGAIGTPAIMLRSQLPDPQKVIGRRTFLHPVVVTAALMKDKVEPYTGAPQTVYSDHYLDTIPLNGPMGFKLEAPPIHPILASISLPGFGADHAAIMSRLPYMQVLLSLMRDGFHEQSQGGQVMLKSDGSPVLDYPITDYVWEGARRSLLTMAEIQFAAGAPIVMPLHEYGKVTRSWAECKKHIESLPMAPLATKVVSAHVMGGSAMSTSERDGVVNHQGRSHLVENLSVHDGSVFPTCIGANPQLSIYGLTARNTTSLIQALKA
jgi:choline dehydrogenase-like flavoprotein